MPRRPDPPVHSNEPAELYGRPERWHDGLSRDGSRVGGQFFGQSSFASYVVANERVVTPLAPDIPMHLGPAFGCGVLTGAGAVLTGLRVQAGTAVVVFGAGAVGLAAIAAAHASGATTIIAVDTNQQRLVTAAELGATHTVHSTGDNTSTEVRAIVPLGAHYSIEATGVPAVARSAVHALQPGGTCALLGVGPAGTSLILDHMQVALLGLTVVGLPAGSCDPGLLVPRLFELYRQGRLPVEKLVRTFAFSEIESAVKAAEEGSVVKPVLLFDHSPMT